MKPEQASTTAKVIAAATLCLASDARARALVPAEAAHLCEIFLSTSATDKLFAGSAKWSLTRNIWRWIERLTLPGIMQHYWLRKHWIEKHCRQAIAAGTKRVLVIGAGFDTLAYRLAGEFTQHEFVEIDHPATQSVKSPGSGLASCLFLISHLHNSANSRDRQA